MAKSRALHILYAIMQYQNILASIENSLFIKGFIFNDCHNESTSSALYYMTAEYEHQTLILNAEA